MSTVPSSVWCVFHHPSISWELWKKKFILSPRRERLISLSKGIQKHITTLPMTAFFFLNTEFAFWGTEVFIYPLLSVIFFFLAVPGLKPCGMLAPQPGINLASLPLQGRFLTTEPSGKSHLLLSLPIKGTEEEEGLGDAWSLYWLTRFSEPRKENRKRWNVSVLWASVITSITKYRSVSCQLYNDHFSCLECGTVR